MEFVPACPVVRNLILAITMILILAGCAPSASDIVEEWKDQGWKIEKIHGQQGPIQRHGKLMNEKAQAVEASWVENGTRQTKLYSQSNHKILVLRFFKKDGDQFAVVLKKRK